MRSLNLEQVYAESLAYYEKEAGKHHFRYTGLKMIEIAAAAAIPLVSLVGRSQIPPALLGALIAIIEGYLGLTKSHERWIAFRKAAESLRIEGLMWRTGSGRYGDSSQSDQLFAEQLVSILQEERSEWVAVFGKAGRQPER